MKKDELKYLKALSKEFPSVASAATEIINLNAILSLPKGTEHFITDIHGEYDQFLHVLKNGSGAIRRKIDEEFGPSVRNEEKTQLASLIYYPEHKLEQVKKHEKNLDEWYKTTIYELIRVCKAASSKYTRSKVRKAMPSEFAYVIEELMTGRPDDINQEAYYSEIVNSVIETKRAKELIIALCNLIRRLVVDHLHVVGDIFDRGPYPHLVMDTLIKYHSLDLQWGNHDVLWMGAAAGSNECIANVVRICARYGNLDILEDAYGINMVPLVRFAMETYRDDPCDIFKVKYSDGEFADQDVMLDKKIHKAISIIQFKLEGALIKRRPDFDMDNRLLLDKIDPEKGTVEVDGSTYKMLDMNFPTVDWNNPYKLSKEEEDLVHRMQSAFKGSHRLQEHIRFLYTKGSMYKCFNGNLLYHGCVPLNDDGSFRQVDIYGKKVSGKALFDRVEMYARKGYYSDSTAERQKGRDMLWYMWEGHSSPVFGKKKMATFERYFIADKTPHKEPKDAYYKLYENEEIVCSILKEFGLDENEGRIVNGHVPVEQKAGESPIKCNGRLLVIDGGFSRAYQPKTGIAGYTLIYNSYGMILAAHDPFTSVEDAVTKGSDIHSHTRIVNRETVRKTVADTDVGRELKSNVEDLNMLLKAYRSGLMRERDK